MRRKWIAVWIFILFLLFASVEMVPVESADFLYQTFTENFYEKTGSLNAVTAIYLDYRLYDTIFETLTLLVSVIGIIYFSRHEGEY